MEKRVYITLILLLMLLPLTVSAQRTQKVEGEYTYYASKDESIATAKAKALEFAKNKAIGRAFGTVISQTTTQTESYDDGEEHVHFAQLSQTEVRGEWIEDTATPTYKVELIDDEIVVHCKVSGVAREHSNKAIDFEAIVLRNYPELKDANTKFKDGDDMYLYFDSPATGYVAVYLVDEEQKAYCLLPYRQDTDGQQKVLGSKEYTFFSIDKALSDKNIVDEYYLPTDKAIERDKIYVIFSRKPFTKAVDHQLREGIPRELSYKDFQHWLGRQRANDPEMGVKVIHIEITK